jgi:hypothetical protein
MSLMERTGLNPPHTISRKHPPALPRRPALFYAQQRAPTACRKLSGVSWKFSGSDRLQPLGDLGFGTQNERIALADIDRRAADIGRAAR